MSKMRAAAREVIAHANRFVRFGYRRPPPWPLKSLPRTRTISSPDQQVHPIDHPDTSHWSQVQNPRLTLTPIPSSQDPSMVPVLAHGIGTVLRGDGVYPLEAPWTLPRASAGARKPFRGTYRLNYGDSLRKIVQPDRIAWHNIPNYIPAAFDERLHHIAAATPGVRYCSSTSSISPAIAALYHLLSNFRDTDLTGGLSSHIDQLPSNFAKFHRRPIAFTVKSAAAANVLSVNAHSGPDTGPSILRDLGHAMERMLTNDPDAFASKYVLPSAEIGSAGISGSHFEGASSNEEQFFHYSQASKFLLRAQIDCRNPNTGEVFDVKTRAVAAIRYDLENYQSSKSHRLRYLRGRMDSYEREFYDMVRTVFLKYALQLKIGRMSGALVAYHNTTEVLGLEYISLPEIHSYIFGGEKWADMAFGAAVHLLEEILDKCTKALFRDEPGESLKVVLCTEWSRLRMHIFVQRMKEGEEDKFSSSRFMETELDTSGSTSNARGYQGEILTKAQWHFDSGIHENRRGVAAVGAHNSIAAPPSVAQSSKKVVTDAFNYNNYDTATLNEDNFRVFDLRVFPLINDEVVPRPMIHLDDKDTFRLRYKLEEVQNVKKDHLAKFVTSLGRIYMQNM